MIYTDFSAQIRRQLEESTANTWEDTSILHWTNEAIKDVARKTKARRDEQYATAVVSQVSYALPTGTLSVISCKWESVAGDVTPLLREDVDDLIERGDLLSAGVPCAFAVDDDAIYLRPVPAEAGTIRFWRYCLPPAVAAIDAVTEVPFSDRYSTALEYYVLMRAFEQINDWRSSDAYRDRYNEYVHNAVVQEEAADSAGLSAAPVEVY